MIISRAQSPAIPEQAVDRIIEYLQLSVGPEKSVQAIALVDTGRRHF